MLLTYINQSTDNNNPMFSVGMSITLHSMATITTAALGTAADDMLANVQANLHKYYKKPIMSIEKQCYVKVL